MDNLNLYKLIKASHNKIEALESELNVFRSKKNEPLAIIGMGCRFPGADNPEEFWQLLYNGVDVIREVPKNHWDLAKYYDPNPETIGKTHIRHGGFLELINQFDAHFFGISPRAAVSLDPQQRLLMEVAWEALENAALLPQQLLPNTGVFVGISGSQYANLLLEQAPADLNVYMVTGTSTSVAAGRLSYFLGVQGPSLSVDTACSSSLVSVHLACQSLRHHECDLALAGGVNVNLVPQYDINLSKGDMLAADGRCKTFDAQADGYGRSEGCGMIVIKRLSDALTDGDRILALIRGSAINQDGHTSGLTVPNGPAQQAVIREALKNAHLEPAQVSYVEAHGTGTPLGDPIEVGALQAVFSQTPLIIGSVKTNLGHLEPASGIAGLMKVVLSLQHQEIPPNLHFQTPNPHINWSESLTVPTKPIAWPLSQEGSRIAGVSSFGFSGTNAHVILEQAPPKTETEETSHTVRQILTLSAKTSNALMESVKRYLEYQTTHPTVDLADICFTANTGRTHWAHRLSVVAHSKDKIHEELVAFAAGQETSQVFHGHAQQSPKIAFLFTGQGSQYIGMGRELYENQPVFRQALDRCDEILRRGAFFEQSLLDILSLTGPLANAEALLNETAMAQPALFALEYALVQLWQSWGITPAVVCGHSVGEYVGACVAGVFSLEDGLKLIAERGRLMQALTLRGQMVALWASEDQVTETIRPYTDKISIAAINGPENVVISGDVQAIERVVAQLEEEGIRNKPLPVFHAFHSPLMEPMLKAFEQVARQVSYSTPRIKIISNVTGQLAQAEMISTPEYWCRHIRQPVRFADGMNTLQQLGYDTFVEIGPQPVLLGMASHFIPAESGVWLPSLRKDRHTDEQQMFTSLAELYVHGAEVNWQGFEQAHATVRRRVALPTYPWQRQVYWPIKAQTSINKPLSPLIDKMTGSPLLKETIFETLFSTERMPFLLDHRVYQEVVVPGACHLSLLLSVAEQLFGKQAGILEDVVFPKALVLPEGSERTVQVILTSEKKQSTFETTAYSFQVISFPTQEAIVLTEQQRWEVHAIGRLFATQLSSNGHVSIQERLNRCQEKITSDTLYQKLAKHHINLGHHFQWVDGIWQGDGEVLSQMKRPQEVNIEGYVLHPSLIDSSLQLATMTTSHNEEEETTLPFAIEKCRFYPHHNGHIWGYVRKVENMRWDIQLLDESGQVIIEMVGFEGRPTSKNSLLVKDTWHDWLYEVQWESRARFGFTLPFPSPQPISQHLPGHISTTGSELPAYQRKLERLEAVSADYVLTALHKLGFQFQPGIRWKTTQLAQQLGVTDQYHPLLGRLLEILAEEGTLRMSTFTASGETEWEVKRQPTIHKPEELGNRLFAQYGRPADIILLTRCAEKLSDVLRGTQNPLELLFPNGEANTVNQIYQEAPMSKLMNSHVQQVIMSVLDKVPEGRGSRILEVGAGTGGTTSHILPHLRAEKTEYTFTDIGSLFISKAQEIFKDFSFVSYQTLDIERDPAKQGFEYNQYDIIIAANVLHATQNLQESVAYVRRLLTPGGILILLEGTTRQRWIDLTFGLTEGWWRFNDYELRPDYPLLDVQRWQSLLQSGGFKSVESLPQQNDLRSAVIVAQADEKLIPQGRHWLIFVDHNNSLGVELATQLSARGDSPILVYPTQTYKQVDSKTIQLDPYSATDYSRLLQEMPNVHGVVYLWNINQRLMTTTSDLLTLSKQMYEGLLFLLQALLKCANTPSLWLVTSDAQAVTKADKMNGIMQSLLWGIGQVIVQEHPELECVLVDLDASISSVELSMDDVDRHAIKKAGQFLAETVCLSAPEPKRENKVAFRNGQRYVARLVRHAVASASSDSLETIIRSDGTYLITGGLGGLGLRIARWMVELGAGQIILMGRSEPNEQTKKQLAELAQAGTQITVTQADVTNTKQVAQVLSKISTERPLRGIIHSAMVLSDSALLNENWAHFAKVLAPKVQGAWNLHTLTQERPLDFFVLFSSISGLLGSRGQVNYASANTFLDGLAHYRKSQNQPALSIDWGTWAEVGYVAKTGLTQQFERQGFETITPALGLQAMSTLIKKKPAQVAVAPINWSKWLPSIQPSPFFDNVFWQESKEQEPQVAETVSFLQKLKKTPVAERRTQLVAHVCATVGKVFGTGQYATPSEQFDLEQDFSSYGMDSITSLELRNRLQNSLECSLSATLAFKYPNISALVDYLAEEVLGEIFETRTMDSYRTCLIPIQPHGNKPPLFFVAGFIGTALNLQSLSSHLGSEQPFYGLQAAGLEGEIEPYTQIEEMAAHYIKALQTIQPQGPYFLGGYSWGGKVAFEMVHQLTKQGQEVPLLIIIDIPVNIVDATRNYMASSKGEVTDLTELAYMFEGTWKEKLHISPEQLAPLTSDEQVDFFLERLKNVNLNISKREIQQLLRIYKNNFQADLDYVYPDSSVKKILFFKATQSLPALIEVADSTDPTWGWANFSEKPVELHVIQGDHYTMMIDPNIQVLAEKLKACLDQQQN